MHKFIVNASLQVLPIVQDRHPYEWVDEAILIIQRSGLKHEIGAFATVIEGTYDEVINLINAINEHLYTQECQEWILQSQIQIRTKGDMLGEEKISKFH